MSRVTVFASHDYTSTIRRESNLRRAILIGVFQAGKFPFCLRIYQPNDSVVGINREDFAIRRKSQGKHTGCIETRHGFPGADPPYAKAIAAGDQPSPVRTEESISANPGRDIFFQLTGSGIPNLDHVAA